MFIDEVKIFARAGHGGRGCVAFLREAYRPKGGPDGGNGGRGGHVILEADPDVNNLVAQYYKPRLIAPNGNPGSGKNLTGRAGRDLIIKVPRGTLVWRRAIQSKPVPPPCAPADEGTENAPDQYLPISHEQRPKFRHAGEAHALEFHADEQPPNTLQTSTDEDRELVTDLTQPGERFLLCKGGRGGRGNKSFATATRQTPRFAQPGEPGEEGHYLLELRLLADVGLVGYPNAGKSTLLSAVSDAHPKIAPYPFTTLHPHLGIISYPDYTRLTLCDIPGLIEGAHRNVGLGHAFLRHVQRCAGLAIVLDMAGTDGRNPWDDYQNLLRELELYDSATLNRPRLVVANKMDEPVAPSLLKKFRRRNPGVSVVSISAAFDQGMDRFKNALRRLTQPSVGT